MTFTVRAALVRVARLLRERGVIPVCIDAVDDTSCCVSIPESQALGLIAEMDRNDIVVEANRPRALYTDPTFARAAQHIALRERGR